MQAQLLVGPIPTITGLWAKSRRRRGWAPLAATAEQNHYAVLGLNLSATSTDIKTAYRLLARKYHPDVSKDSQASQVFKRIRLAYEVLSNEATRTHYDRNLKFGEDTEETHHQRQRNYDDPELDDRIRIRRWDELRRRTRRKQYREEKEEEEESNKAAEESNPSSRRGPLIEILRSAFVSLFLLRAFGARVSLSFSSAAALLDMKLDGGYKMGYVVAWVLGGRGGILLTLCLSFASWACGKTSSSVVAVVVVAIWVGSGLARLVPLPRGALLTLLYMSIKLQLDLN